MVEAFKTFVRTEGFFIFLILLVVVASFYPILFGRQAFFDEEQMGFYYAQSFFYKTALTNDSSLEWNNGYYGGVPVGLDQFVNSFYPLHQVLFRWFDFFDAHHLSIVLAVFVGCLLAYWFGRAAKLSPLASLALALGYLSATGYWNDIGTLSAHSFLALPGMLLAVFKIREGKNIFGYTLLGAASLAIGLLAGFMQIMFYNCTIVLFFALYLDFRHQGSSGFFAKFKSTTALVVMAFIGLILGGRQVLPSVLLIDKTIRASTLATEVVHKRNILDFISFVFPDYVKAPFLGGGVEGFYIGALPFVAMIFGVFLFRTKLSVFFLALYGLLLGVSYHFPPLRWLNEHIPPFSHMSSSLRWMVPAAFPIAFLGASGLEGVLSRKPDFSVQRWIKFIGWFVAAALVAGVILSLIFVGVLPKIDWQERFLKWYFSGKILNFPMEYYHNVLNSVFREFKTIVAPFNWKFMFPLVLLFLSFMAVRSFLKEKISLRYFRYLAAVLIILGALLGFMASWSTKFVPRRSFIQEPALVRAMKKDSAGSGPWRFAGFLQGDSLFWQVLSKRQPPNEELVDIYRELLINNLNVYHGIQRIDGMEPYRLLRHNHLLNTLIFPAGLDIFDKDSSALAQSRLTKRYNSEVLKKVALEEKIKNFIGHLPLLSMLNVKYIYSLIPLSDPRLKIITTIEVPHTETTAYLYRNENVLPRVYFAGHSQFVKESSAGLFLKKMEEVADFSKDTLIECAICSAGAQGQAVKRKINSIEYGNGFLHAKTSLEEAGWFVFGESNVPGWEVKIDGEIAPVYPANYIFMAVYVPEGSRDIEFNYKGVVSEKWQATQALKN